MYNDDDISGGFNNLAGPYQFLNQAAVTNAMASGQNIDWAQLAQQWIQMRDSTTIAIGVTDISTSAGGNVSGQSTIKYEEKGEADMDMDDEEHMEERTTADRNKRNLTSAVMQHQPSNANRPWFTEKSNLSNAELRTGVSSHKTNQWPSAQTLLQASGDPSVANRQTNSTAHIPSLLSMNVPHPNEIRALPDNHNEQNTMMDAAKRKALPAWIREGLEKMEREKQKQHEKHYKDEHSDDSDDGSLVHFKVATVNSLNLEKMDDEDDDSIEPPVVELGTQSILETGISAENEVYRSYEQKLSELMVVVRRTLTELLLEVTNEEISKVANEAIKIYKLKASSAQVIHNSALSSITSKLGLAAYDDSSSDECCDDGEDEDSPVRKTFPSESGNDSEEDIKNTVRSKRRAFAKIANEIEERVAAAASKEEEKLKYFSSKDEAYTSAQKNKSMERNTGSYHREVEPIDTHLTQTSAGCSGKLFERDTGETTETMLQTLNGKLQKERGARKERTTRFSDNRDNKYLAIAASASYIREMQSKDPINTISSQSLTSLGQTSYKTTALPSCTSATVEAGAETNPKYKTALSPEKIIDRDRDKKLTYLKNTLRRRASGDSTPGSQSSSSSTSTSSTSSDLDSSTSNSSDISRYSNKSNRKHSSHVSNTDKSSKTSRQSQRDKRDDRKYHSYADKDRDSYHSRYRNDRSRSRSRSRHGRRRHGSHDSDKDYSRRKHDSRYSSSHSRSRNSSRRYHDHSTSNSRSSYSSSSNRRH